MGCGDGARYRRAEMSMDDENSTFTLAEAYEMARRGVDVTGMEPVEFATMRQATKRAHLRTLERIAREHRYGKDRRR